MKAIDINDLDFITDDYDTGSFSKVQKCYYNNNNYACKTFEDLKFLNKRINFLQSLSNYNIKGLCLPKVFVKDDNNIIGYLTKYINGKNITSFKKSNYETKYNILMNLKNNIINMHKNRIIHGDLHGGNILVENGIPIIIDFDNITCDFNKTDINDTNDLAKEFILKYGVIKELDIYLFNILTFSIINDCDLMLARREILRYNYKYFDNDKAKEICETLFLDSDKPNDKFLIDEANIKY